MSNGDAKEYVQGPILAPFLFWYSGVLYTSQELQVVQNAEK